MLLKGKPYLDAGAEAIFSEWRIRAGVERGFLSSQHAARAKLPLSIAVHHKTTQSSQAASGPKPHITASLLIFSSNAPLKSPLSLPVTPGEPQLKLQMWFKNTLQMLAESDP